jgi:small subunit ribosomal protein S17
MTEAVEAQGAEAAPRRAIKERRGKIVSAKMEKTVIVEVERRIRHRRYKKYVKVRERYAAHDNLGCAEGDIVLIKETRPMSKTKRWRVSRKLGHQE